MQYRLINENGSFLGKDQPVNGVIWVTDPAEAEVFQHTKQAIRRMQEIDPDKHLAIGVQASYDDE